MIEKTLGRGDIDLARQLHDAMPRNVDVESRQRSASADDSKTFVAAVALDAAANDHGGERTEQTYFTPPPIEHLTLEVLQERYRDYATTMPGERADRELTDTEEIELVCVVQQGRGRDAPEDRQRAALAESVLAAHYLPIIRSYVANRVAPHLRAGYGFDTVVADGELALVKEMRGINLSNKRPGFTFGKWMVGVMRNKLIDGHRAQGTHGLGRIDFCEPDSYELRTAASDSDSAEEALANIGDERLAAALAGLSEERRRLLVWRIVHGIPSEEIGQTVGKSAVAVRVAQTRALKELRRLYEQAGR